MNLRKPAPPRLRLPDGRLVHLAGLEYAVIGRKPDCDIVIDDATISGHHARLRHDASGRWIIHDLHSANGVKVNGHQLGDYEPMDLSDGDAITMGVLVLRLELSEIQIAEAVSDTVSPKLLTSGSTTATDKQMQEIISVGQAATEQELIDRLLDVAISLTGYHRCAIVSPLDAACEQVQILGSRAQVAGQADAFSRSLLRAALRGEVVTVLTPDFPRPPDGSIARHKIHSACCVRLTDDRAGRVRALIMDSRDEEASRPLDAARPLAILAMNAAAAFDRIQTLDLRARESERQNEIKRAVAIQEVLLPPPSGSVLGRAFTRVYRPGAYVAGDLMGVQDYGNTAAIWIGDVMGHGLSAAMVMAIVQDHLQRDLRAGMPIAQIMKELHNYVCGKSYGFMHTLWLGRVSLVPEGLSGDFLEVGHGYALLRYPDGSTEWLRTASGIGFVGAEEDPTYSSEPIVIPNGSTLILLTDGIIEQVSPTGTRFGQTALLSVVRSSRPERLADAIMEAVDRFADGAKQNDDQSILIVQA